MSKPYRIIVKVISVQGTCKFGHEVADQVIFDGETIQGRVRLNALYLRPALRRRVSVAEGQGCGQPRLPRRLQPRSFRNPQGSRRVG